MKNIWIEDIERQRDGRYTITFKENNTTFKQTNVALCCNGHYYDGTGNDKDTRTYILGFEVLTCYHPPKDINDDNS